MSARLHRCKQMKFLEKLSVAGLGIAGCFAFAPLARAQVAGPVAKPEVEGPGIAVGDSLVLHPAVEAEAGYISNVFYEEAGAIGAGLLRLSARLDLASKEIKQEEAFGDDELGKDAAPRDVEMRVGARISYEQMLSDNQAVRDQSNANFDIGGDFKFRPGRPVSFQLNERVLRDIRPRNFEATSSTARIGNSFLVGVTWAPGGGAIWSQLRYENYLDVFEDSGTAFANRMNHTIGLQGNWQWLPFSRLFVDATYGFNGPLGSSTLGGAAFKASSQPIRGVVGIATALSQRMSIKARVGWQYASFSAGAGYNAPVAGVEWGFRYGEHGGVGLEYEMERFDSVNANFFRDHRFEAKIGHAFGQFQLSGNASVRLRRYNGIPPQLGAATRDDLVLSAAARASYIFGERYALTLQYTGTSVSTDYVSTFAGVSDDPSYGRDELMLGFRAGF